jgi:hypothetical protein
LDVGSAPNYTIFYGRRSGGNIVPPRKTGVPGGVMAKRKSKKLQYHKLLQYTVVVLKDGKLKFLDLTGKIIDISANSVCFLTRYPLKTGSVIDFKNKVFQCSQGVVMRIRHLGNVYVAGTKLIRKNDRQHT